MSIYYFLFITVLIYQSLSLQIFVKSINGKTILIEADSNEMIWNLKRKIYNKQRIIPSFQSISYAGRILHDHDVVSDYSIVTEATLHLSFRARSEFAVEIGPSEFIPFNFPFNKCETLNHFRKQIVDNTTDYFGLCALKGVPCNTFWDVYHLVYADYRIFDENNNISHLHLCLKTVIGDMWYITHDYTLNHYRKKRRSERH
eukprot:405082_1